MKTTARSLLLPVVVLGASAGCGAVLLMASSLNAWPHVFISVAGALVVWSLATRPRIPLGVFLFLWAPTLFLLKDTDLVTIGDRDLNLSRLIGGLLLTGLLLRVGFHLVIKRSSLLGGYESVPLLVFGLYLFIPLLKSPNVDAAGAELVRYWTGLLFFLVLRVEIDNEDSLAFLFRAASGGIVAAGVLTLLAWKGPEWLGLSLVEKTEGVVRAAGTTGAAGATGALLLTGLVFLLAPPTKLLNRYDLPLRVVGVCIVSISLVATLTRAVILALPPFILLWTRWVYAERLSWRSRHALLLAGLVIPAAILLVLQGNAFVARLSDIPFLGTTLDDMSSGTGRLAVWGANLDAWRTASFGGKMFGLGLHSSSLLTLFGARESMEVGPHNTYLWLLVETGVVGLLIYLTFIVGMSVYLLRLLRALRDFPDAERVRTFVAACASYFIVYHLCEEMFMSQVVSFGGHAYFLAIIAFATSAAVRSLAHQETGSGATLVPRKRGRADVVFAAGPAGAPLS